MWLLLRLCVVTATSGTTNVAFLFLPKTVHMLPRIVGKRHLKTIYV